MRRQIQKKEQFPVLVLLDSKILQRSRQHLQVRGHKPGLALGPHLLQETYFLDMNLSNSRA